MKDESPGYNGIMILMLLTESEGSRWETEANHTPANHTPNNVSYAPNNVSYAPNNVSYAPNTVFSICTLNQNCVIYGNPCPLETTITGPIQISINVLKYCTHQLTAQCTSLQKQGLKNVCIYVWAGFLGDFWAPKQCVMSLS